MFTQFHQVTKCLTTSCLFFFNYTATTEIYTFRHPLSLHDALPILGKLINAGAGIETLSIERPSLHDAFVAIVGPDAHNMEGSEEHTSKLQSLMRISYAVFCLKKKTQKQLYPNTTYYPIYQR